MLEKDFHESLQDLYVRNQRPSLSAAELEKLRLQFAYILQSYLWEGEALKTLNKTNYRHLALAWHPDKLKSDDGKLAFLSWHIQINEKDPGSLFKVLSYVKETYRPELRYRAEDASRANNADNANRPNRPNNKPNENFHFFSAFAIHLPLIYSVLWPIFYALESLERNLDNYSPERRAFAKLVYYGSVMTPLLLFCICLDPKILNLILHNGNSLITRILSDGFVGMTLIGMSFCFGLVLTESFIKADETPDFISLLFFHIPITPLFKIYKELTQNIKKGSPLKTKIFSLGKCAIATIAAVTHLFATACGLYYALPMIGGYVLFALGGLLLANVPLMMFQIYHQPRNSFALVGEYFITIGTHYFHLAKKTCQFVYDAVLAVVSKFSPMAAWVKHLFASTPKASAKPSEPPAPPASPISAPYWKTKFDKYMQHDEDKIAGKKNKLKKERNTILTTMGVGEDHPFKEKLDKLINQKSATYDANGFVVEDGSDKKLPILEVLNLKTQVLFLNNALENKTHLPRAQFEATYPQDLDYRKLVAKNVLG